MTVIDSFDITIAVRRLPVLTAETLTRALADLGLRVGLPPGLRIDDELRYTPVRVFLEDGVEIKTGLSIILSEQGADEDEEEDDAGAEEDGSPEEEDEDLESDDDEADDDDESDEEDDDLDADDDDSDDEGDDDEDESDDDEADLDADPSEDDEEYEDEEAPLIEGQIAQLSIWAKNSPMPADENEVPLALYVAAAIAKLGDGEVFVHPWEDDALSAEELVEKIDETFDSKKEAWDDYPYALFLAAEDGDAAAVADALTSGAPVDVMNNQGVTPLMLALANDRPAAAWELLRGGAKPRAVNYFGKTAVEYADECSDDWLRQEIARRARFPHDELFELVSDGDTNGVLAALSAGAPVNAATPEGFTLLMAAVRMEDENLVDALLKRGASVELTTNSGSTVLDVAEAIGNEGLSKLLQSKGAKRSG